MFVFNEISESELKEYHDMAFVFNISRSTLDEIPIIQNKFETDDMGGSAECVDMFIEVDGNLVNIDTVVNKEKFFAKESETSESGRYTIGGMMELLDSKDIKISGMLVLVRVMSNFLLDIKSTNVTATYYNICSDELGRFLEDNPALDGWIAKKRIKLKDDYRESIGNILDLEFNAGLLSEYNYNLYRQAL